MKIKEMTTMKTYHIVTKIKYRRGPVFQTRGRVGHLVFTNKNISTIFKFYCELDFPDTDTIITKLMIK